MEYSVQKLSKTKIEIAISIEKEEWESYAKEAYAKNKFKYSLEGFRKGKAAVKSPRPLFPRESGISA